MSDKTGVPNIMDKVEIIGINKEVLKTSLKKDVIALWNRNVSRRKGINIEGFFTDLTEYIAQTFIIFKDVPNEEDIAQNQDMEVTDNGTN